MAKKDRKFKIEMVMTGGKETPVLKNHQGHTIPPAQPLVFDKNADNMRKVDHYRIRFELDKPHQTNLRFLQNKVDVMWCQAIPACPTGQCDMPGVFWVDEIDGDGEWIDVINMDMTKLDFGFLLNFADKNIPSPTPSQYVALDPVGENQNGGRAGSDSFWGIFASFSLGLASGVAAIVAARAFLPEW